MATDIDIEPAPPLITVPALTDAPLYLLSVEQYHAMTAAGILTGHDRIELLEGCLVTKMTKNPPHVIATKLMHQALGPALPPGWHLAQEAPVVFLPRSEPEPDFTVVRGAIRDYAQRNPGPEDVGLLVEVADSSLDRDRKTKLRIYARAGIPVYWIVNLIDRRVEVYTDPTGPADAPEYRRRQDHGPEDALPLLLDGRDVARLAVRDLLP